MKRFLLGSLLFIAALSLVSSAVQAAPQTRTLSLPGTITAVVPDSREKISGTVFIRLTVHPRLTTGRLVADGALIETIAGPKTLLFEVISHDSNKLGRHLNPIPFAKLTPGLTVRADVQINGKGSIFTSLSEKMDLLRLIVISRTP